MILACLILLIIFKLFLAGKDASSFLLKDNTSPSIPLKFRRIKRWHRDGVAIDALFTGVLAWASGLIIPTIGLSLLVRLAIYDLAFNKWASLPLTFLGSTALWDRIFSKIFGQNGAVRKSIFFGAASVLWVILDLCL